MDQRERELESLRQSRESACNQGKRRLAEIRRELDVHAKSKEHPLARHHFLVRHAARVVAADICAIAQVATAFRPERRNQKRVVVHLRHRSHVGTVDFALFDMAARCNDRRLHNRLAADLAAAHQHGTLDLGARMYLYAHLHIRIFENHGIVDMARFFKRTHDDGIANLRGTFDAGMRTNPAIADNVRIRNNGALPHNPKRECKFGPIRAEHFSKRILDALFSLVEQLQIDKLRREFRENQHFAATHLVTDINGRTNHVVDFAATHERAYILHNRTTAYKHIA